MSEDTVKKRGRKPKAKVEPIVQEIKNEPIVESMEAKKVGDIIPEAMADYSDNFQSPLDAELVEREY
jgi:hypothetical protein